MKRRRLGQHLLANPKLLNTIVDCAQLQGKDVVFEIGAGTGELTERLCGVAAKVYAAEIDPTLYRKAEERLSRFTNLQLMNIDGFEFTAEFDVFVSNLPYSESSHFIEWLATKKYRRAVVMLQREFVDKVTSKPGIRNYRAISALAQAIFHIKRIAKVGRSSFRPRPKVYSTLIIIEPKSKTPVNLGVQRALKKLFSFRGRILSSALRQLTKREGVPYAPTLFQAFSKELLAKRIQNLIPSEALLIAQTLEKMHEHA